MATAITFNGFSFQDANILSSGIDRYGPASREIQSLPLSFSNRQKVVSAFYKEKKIVIVGTLVSTTESGLQTLISNARKNLNAIEAVLQIPFNGLTLQYQATMIQAQFPRENYNVAHCSYEIEFSVVNPPFGLDTTSNNHSNNGITGASVSSTLTIGGEIPSEPIITITVNSETDLTVITFTQDDTAESITITPGAGFAASDVLVLNTQNKSCLLNGAVQDYTGIFPKFIVGTNNYTLASTATARNLDLDIDWQNYYL